jgi:hypothetical protein
MSAYIILSARAESSDREKNIKIRNSESGGGFSYVPLSTLANTAFLRSASSMYNVEIDDGEFESLSICGLMLS